MNICVIPARGGSKRIPRKNVKTFCEEPIISFSIKVATESGYFDKILVSTEDSEVAKIATHYGAEVPFWRPQNLSDDFTGTVPVMQHAVEWVIANVGNVDLACCLYATAPFVSVKDLTAGFNMIKDGQLEYVFAATSYPFPIQRSFEIDAVGRVNMLQPEHYLTRSQDLAEAWHDAGQFYWGTAEAWCGQRNVFGPYSGVVKLPRSRVQDIDTAEDWERAESMFKVMQARGAV